jgi:hypothetical protein
MPRVTWTPEMVAELTKLRSRKVPLEVCAERVGVAVNTAVKKCRELGFRGWKYDARGPKVDWTPKLVERLIALRRQRVPLEKCAQELGIGYHRVLQKARELNVTQRDTRHV